MRPFEHVDARSIEHACTLLGDHKGRARLNAGGTDLLSLLKGEELPDYPELLINIKTLAGLNFIREEPDGLKIGALTRLSDIAQSPLINERYRLLAAAAHSVASPPIRNVATLGGNLCQEVRCWYYRYPRQIGGPVNCLRKGQGACLAVKGDNRYHAVMGAKKCFAVCPSDTAVALSALDARIGVVGAGGARSIAVSDFYHSLGNRLAAGEMVQQVEIPLRPTTGQQIFSKFTVRKPIDFAIVSAAVALTVDRAVCTQASIVLGAMGPAPVRAAAAEAILVGQPLSNEVAQAAAEAAVVGAKPLSKNGYKIQIAKTLVQRAILGAAQ